MNLEQYIQNLNSVFYTGVTNDVVPTGLPDLNHESINEFAKKINLDFLPIKENGNVCFANNNEELRDDFKQVFSTIDFLDYIYAVSFSITFKDKFPQKLSADFPKIPFPKVSNGFWKLVKLGRQIREIHLLKSKVVHSSFAQFFIEGDNLVRKTIFKNSKVYINETQCFENIPEAIWSFYLGNAQPAQKWINDKKGQKLELDDINHYHKIVAALIETDKIIEEINKIVIQ